MRVRRKDFIGSRTRSLLPLPPPPPPPPHPHQSYPASSLLQDEVYIDECFSGDPDTKLYCVFDGHGVNGTHPPSSPPQRKKKMKSDHQQQPPPSVKNTPTLVASLSDVSFYPSFLLVLLVLLPPSSRPPLPSSSLRPPSPFVFLSRRIAGCQVCPRQIAGDAG